MVDTILDLLMAVIDRMTGYTEVYEKKSEKKKEIFNDPDVIKTHEEQEKLNNQGN